MADLTPERLRELAQAQDEELAQAQDEGFAGYGYSSEIKTAFRDTAAALRAYADVLERAAQQDESAEELAARLFPSRPHTCTERCSDFCYWAQGRDLAESERHKTIEAVRARDIAHAARLTRRAV